MSLKTYNAEKDTWEAQQSSLAKGIRVIDAEGNYESRDVEGCLKEIATTTDKLTEDVKYIYENGTLGGNGGGGGGGGSRPQVKLDSPASLTVSTDTIIEVYYFFSSPNVGNGIASLSINNKTTNVDIKQGKNKWVVGTLERGTHLLDIFVTDKDGLISNSISVQVTVGALEVTSDFNDSEEFTMEEDIVIDYEIASISPDDVSVDLTLDGNKQTVKGIIGKNSWNIGRLTSLGVHKASIKAYSGGMESNELQYNIILADSAHLYVSTTFKDSTIEFGKRLVVDYRISMKGETRFVTSFYIDNQLINTVNSRNGVSYWDVGNQLEIGEHTLKIVTKTLDGQFTSNELIIPIEVTAFDFIPFKPVTRDLIAHFDANLKLNDSILDRDIWEDKSGNNVKCTLHNFNYSTNGWIDGTLKFIGKTYAKIDMRPLADNIPKGFTLDIMCKINNVGDIDAKVLDCKNLETPYQGFTIDTMKAQMRSVGSKIVESEFREDVWVRQTFVVDRENRLMILYTNGVVAKVALLDAQENFRFDSPIILGASLDEQGNIVHNSSSSIKTLRIYNSPLTHAEVLQNHIADIRDVEEQKAIRELNFGEEGIPTMRIEGDINGMTNEVKKLLKVTYTDPKNPNKNFSKDQCLVSWQGTSSLKYPIKNYTLELRDGGNDWLDYSPKDDWLPEYRYTLKANFMETSHTNNIGTARFAHESLFLENPYPNQIKNPKTRMSVDGFPIKLIINGEDKGLYTFNIDRYAHNNYGLLNEPTAVSYEISVNSESGAGAFADDSWESIRAEFEYRYHYAGNEEVVTERLGENIRVLKQGYHTDLQDLVSWVYRCTDTEFASQLEEHFSKRHLIDYYLTVYLFGLVDSLGKNMVLTTWGRNSEGNVIWYPSFYDADTMFGLTNDGQMIYPPSIDMQFGDFNTSNSVLWTKLLKMFGVEIADRYKELRLNQFSLENLLSYYDTNGVAKIGQRFYNEDAFTKYISEEGKPWLYVCNGTRLEFTKRWLEERLIYMDSIYEYGDFYQKSAILRSNIQGNVSLRLKTYSPQWIEVKFSDEATNKFKKFVDKDKWYEFTGNLKNPKDNNIEITGAGNIMYIDGITDLMVSGLLLENARKIVEVDVSGSKYLHQLILGNNYLLQSVNCKNCVNLGLEAQFKTVDLSQCVNLRHLDCSNTKIGQVIFNEEGGSLETLNLSNTEVTQIHLSGQEYLPTILLDNCRELSDVVISKCNALTTLSLPNSKLANFRITDCDNIQNIDISYTGYLTGLDLSGCSTLEKLVMSGVSNPTIKEVDLTYCPNIQYLDISKCSNITSVKFAEGCTSLTHFEASNSGIKQFKYGRQTPKDYLDLGGFDLNYVNFYNCGGVEEIHNINLTAHNSSPFYNCVNLRKIDGNVTLTGSLTYGFRNCAKLVEFPSQFDLSGVTGISECFLGCTSLTLEHLKMLLSKLTNVQNCYQAFNGCTGIESTEIPKDLFKNNRKITSMQWMFTGSNLKGQLPLGIFDPLTELTNFRNPFGGKITGYLPPNLFKYNTKLETIEDAFSSCKLTLAPDKSLLATCKKLRMAKNAFGGCSTMVGEIDPAMFANNPGLTDVSQFFRNCSGLVGNIPSTLLNKNTKLTTVASLFEGCSGLTGQIPMNLLKNNPLITQAPNLFRGCEKLTGYVSSDLFRSQPNIVDISNVFNGCKGLGGAPGEMQEVPIDFFRGKRNLLSVNGLFKGCELLQFKLHKDMFKDNTSLTKIAEVFSGCLGLTGEIPEGLFTCYDESGNEVPTMIEEANGVFSGCKYLVSRIPADLFDKFLLVKNLNQFFYNCRGLYGEIPAELLYKCFNLISADSMFHMCHGLGKYRVTEEDPYFIDERFFSKCVSLETINNIFNMSDGSPKFIGDIPEELFRFNSKLTNLNHAFYAMPITGTISNMMFKFNPKIENFGGTFRGCGKLEGIESNAITRDNNPNITSFEMAFEGCGAMRGSVPTLWISHSSADRARCFKNCVNVDNYEQIPTEWK